MKSTAQIMMVCLLSALVVGCQDNRSAKPSTRPTGALDSSRDAGAADTEGSGGTLRRADETGEADANAALSADPGMDPDRDKTAAEEQPSGDESSEAGPNDGDAEPPIGSDGSREPE